MSPYLCSCRLRMIAGNTVVLSLCFSRDTGAVLSPAAEPWALRPTLAAATDLLSDPDSNVSGLASYWSHKLVKWNAALSFHYYYLSLHPPQHAYSAPWCEANPAHSRPRGCKSQDQGGQCQAVIDKPVQGMERRHIYLFNLQLGGGLEWAKGLPEVLKGRQLPHKIGLREGAIDSKSRKMSCPSSRIVGSVLPGLSNLSGKGETEMEDPSI